MKKDNGMARVNAVISQPLYRQYYRRLEELEKDRIFCCHQMPHLLDVARIAWICCMEEGLEIKKDVVYAAAILHDIGKARQYEEKIPHEQAGEKIAGEILDGLAREMRFSAEEKEQILTAIKGHRRLRENPDVLERILYESDKVSRICFACPAQKECNWSREKKNMEIKI